MTALSDKMIFVIHNQKKLDQHVNPLLLKIWLEKVKFVRRFDAITFKLIYKKGWKWLSMSNKLSLNLVKKC